MSYRFRTGEPPGEAARRAAREQADKAQDELNAQEKPVAWRVHQLRKRCKKIRAVARLVRPDFDGYKACNRRFRDIARTVSDARDARVMSGLLDEFAGDVPAVVGAQDEPLMRWHRLRCELADAGSERLLPGLQQSMAQGAVSIERWDVSDVSADSLLGGMHKSLGRAHDAYTAVKKDPVAERFHELRKRCKYHWYHMRLLEALLPSDLEARVSVFDELGDLLGDAHDRSMFLAHGEKLPDFVREQPSSGWIFARILERRRHLREKALTLCETALADSADDVKARLGDHWKDGAETGNKVAALPFRG